MVQQVCPGVLLWPVLSPENTAGMVKYCVSYIDHTATYWAALSQPATDQTSLEVQMSTEQVAFQSGFGMDQTSFVG